MTPFGEKLDPAHVYEEHPNPYFERSLYVPLNGYWDFCQSKNKDTKDYPGKILVPFAVETPLSGIGRKVEKDDYLHYRRKVIVPSSFKGKVLRLCFTYVDQVAEVYWNGNLLGTHEGGYLPFDFFIEDYQDENILEVKVQDDTSSPVYPRGKQSKKPRGIWYRPTSGIYGPVYLEAVPKEGHAESFLVTPDYDQASFKVSASLKGEEGEAVISLYHDGLFISKKAFGKKKDGVYEVEIHAAPKGQKAYFYEPDHPELYELVLSYAGDEVKTFTGLRKVEKGLINGTPCILWNGKPIYLSSVLDQGYYPESGLTAPSYEALENDIALVKKLGFNAIRKHIKLETPRFYYLCDKAGIMVIQDFVNGGSAYNPFLIVAAPFIHLPINDRFYGLLGRHNKEGREHFIDSMPKTQDYLHNSTSLFAYTVFNEGWGQFDSVENTKKAKEHDPSRLYDAASGWFDMGGGDFDSRHVYFRRVRLNKPKKGRILFLSEFGGYSLKAKGHLYQEKTFGYKYYPDLKALQGGFSDLFLKDLIPNVEKRGLAASCFTQLSDVEGEVNGLVTYDRRLLKADEKMFKELHERLYSAFKRRLGQ